MTDRRCETCQHFTAWPQSFSLEPQGVCTVPRPAFLPPGNRERQKWDGQKCHVWESKAIPE